MTGLVLAFKKYKVQDGIWVSAWNGFGNFTYLLKNNELPVLFRNTIGYNICFILVNMVLGVTLAILITETGGDNFMKLLIVDDNKYVVYELKRQLQWNVLRIDEVFGCYSVYQTKELLLKELARFESEWSTNLL